MVSSGGRMKGVMLLHLPYERTMEPLKSISRCGHIVRIQFCYFRGCISMRSWKYPPVIERSARKECSQTVCSYRACGVPVWFIGSIISIPVIFIGQNKNNLNLLKFIYTKQFSRNIYSISMLFLIVTIMARYFNQFDSLWY